MYFHRQNKYSSGSLSRLAFRRFINNPLSFTAAFFIIICILAAIAGYLITPDPTPFANRQYLELAVQKPGFRVVMLKVARNEIPVHSGIFHRMIYGQRSNYRYIPVMSVSFDKDEIIYHEFTGDEKIEGPEKTIKLADVVFHLKPEPGNVRSDQNKSYFTLYDNRKDSANIADLSKIAAAQNIITREYYLGTDRFGRDMLSRLLIGTRISLSVGLISVFISLLIGISIGAIGGYFRGYIDNIVVWLINVVWSIPTLLLVIAISFALGKGYWQVFVAVGLTMWVEVARVTRGQILSLREKEFAEAGKALGYSHFRLIFRHLLPNTMGPIIVISAANFASAILIEAGLSFLGLGVQPPVPSWGSMIRDNYSYIILDAAYLAILPGIAIMLMVLAFMIIGNGLRDALDVKVEMN